MRDRTMKDRTGNKAVNAVMDKRTEEQDQKAGNGLISFFKRESKKSGFKLIECTVQSIRTGKEYKRWPMPQN